MTEDANWLMETVADMKRPEAVWLDEAELRLLGYTDLQLCREVRVYLGRLFVRGAGCSLGNFEFWSPQRLRASSDSPRAYGGDSDLLLIADWMLDSEFCAVDVVTGLMVFLGGKSPIRSKLALTDFLERVASDPGTPHGME